MGIDVMVAKRRSGGSYQQFQDQRKCFGGFIGYLHRFFCKPSCCGRRHIFLVTAVLSAAM